MLINVESSIVESVMFFDFEIKVRISNSINF